MKRLATPFWEAVGIIGGMIIGSGMFALPYAVSISGLWWSLIAAAVAFFAVLSLHLAYGEIVANTAEAHRLPGYATYYVGRWAGMLGKVSQVIGFNVSLLIYGILGGIFLSTIFGGSAFMWSLAFFVFGSVLIFFENSEKLGFLDLVLAVPLVAVIIWISILGIQKGSIDRISFLNTDHFFVFGIFVFSLTGLSVIADARELFQNARDGAVKLKKAIITGTTIPLFVYIIFILSVLMVSGISVTPDALTGIAEVMGRQAVIAGALIGILAVFTSFLALGYDLEKMYSLDIKMGSVLSRIVVAAVPIFLFLFVGEHFVKLISIMGGLFVAFDGLLVILILRSLRKQGTAGARFLSFNRFQQIALVSLLFLSIAYEVVYQIF